MPRRRAGHKLPGKAKGLPRTGNWLIDCHVKVYAGDAATKKRDCNVIHTGSSSSCSCPCPVYLV